MLIENEDSVILVKKKKKTDKQINGGTESLEIIPHNQSQLIYDKGPNAIQWKKEKSSTKGASRVEHPYAK